MNIRHRKLFAAGLLFLSLSLFGCNQNNTAADGKNGNSQTAETAMQGNGTSDSLYETVTFTKSGNIFIGDEEDDDLPAGTCQITAGSGVAHFCLYENGELLGEWEISADEGYERELELALENGQVLVSKGSEYWRMEVPADTSENQTVRDADREAVVDRKSVQLSDGEYTAGKDFTAGTYQIVSSETEAAVTVVSSHPYEGGIDAVLYPRSESGNLNSYSSVILQKGDVLRITGGTVKLFAE